ncbi:hypothetical protein [Mycobacteroides abscessus]|uniref:hypothetical protein n=1 Tax=Mycobacteroides abscessus TaxID=36809 RepID=UPI0009260D7B|nr:hypothetical protein [Mycobacteroides abscessus]SIC59260.1 Uncharacterised protein [Mycobacteroides abscessus subsp. abscessus]
MNVLNPSEAQRKAMADYLSFNVDEVIGLYEVDAMIAAANSIPKGAPVGTIARRPDGGWVAHRTVGLDAPFWEYFRLDQNAPARKNQYDADSWPQIRPDQWPDQAGLDWFPPGEEPLVPRPDPTASNADAAPMSEPKGEMFGVILETLDSVEFYGVDAPYLALQVHNALRAAGYDADPTAQQEPEDEGKPEGCTECGFTAYELENGLCEECWPVDLNWHTEIAEVSTKTPRTPRVVDRLGVDEQGSRWVNGKGMTYWFEDDRWYNQAEGEDTPFEFSVGYVPASEAPYTEIVEPRVLPSLDCEEARDGTVWGPVDDLVGRRYKFVSGSWKSKVGDEEWYTLRSIGLLEERFGPFTEVIE